MRWAYDDGGRGDAGYKGRTGDCVTRAIAIASGTPYREVYDALHERTLSDRRLMAKLELRYGANARRHASPRDGVTKAVYKTYLLDHGWRWTPTMGIGTGCRIHLRERDLPAHPCMIASVSRHVCAIVDGEVRDTHDPSRGGTRCVYGVWFAPDRPYPLYAGGRWHEPAGGYERLGR